jgi:phosphoserine phosphatase
MMILTSSSSSSSSSSCVDTVTLVLVVPSHVQGLWSWFQACLQPICETHALMDTPPVVLGTTDCGNFPIALSCQLNLFDESLRPTCKQALTQQCLDAFKSHGLPLDWAWLDAASSPRRKKLLVSDMDSTLLQGECIDELAEQIGLKPKVAEITARAMRGELPFEPALRERVALLKGLSTEVIHKTLAALPYMPGADALCATMKHYANATLVLVSGGFSLFTKPVMTTLGMDAQYSNVLGVCPVTQTLTGEVLGDETLGVLVGQATKQQVLEMYTQKLGLALQDTLAVGDGANDLAMILRSGMGVAYHAKPLVAAQAHYTVQYTDLTTLLYFQGYSQKEFRVPSAP